MRFRKDQIEKISKVVFGHLKDNSLIQAKADDSKILERIERAIIQNLEDEDQLNEEVEKLLIQFQPQIRAGQLNERELFMKIKKELAKKKKFVL